METKHTPGPWKMSVDDTGGAFSGWPSVYGPPHLDVTIVHRAGFRQQFWSEFSMREACANARLIAAAPEMLDALKAVVVAVEKLVDNGTWWADSPTTGGVDLDVVRAAIAKAEGK